MRISVVLLALSWLLGCSPAVTAKAPASARTVATSETPAAAPTPRQPEADHRRVVDRVTVEVARLRRLPLKKLLVVRRITPAQVREHFRRDLAKEYSADYVKNYSLALQRLGLLPPGFDYEKEMIELVGEQVAGFYDSRAKGLYLVKGLADGAVILSHEITHALQDQHFDLQRMTQAVKYHDDRSFGSTALYEGDATLVMTRHLRETMNLARLVELIGMGLNMAQADTGKLDNAPIYIKESMVLAYTEGMKLVSKLHQNGGWSAVNRAYARPPRSSEQVLHPTKYLADEKPRTVTLPDLLPRLGKGARLLHENTLGEVGVRAWLRTLGIGELVANPAAAGWGGDRHACYRSGEGALVSLWTSVWDSAEDAAQFARWFQRGRAGWLSRCGSQNGSGRCQMLGQPYQFKRCGDKVALVEGAPDAAFGRTVLKLVCATP